MSTVLLAYWGLFGFPPKWRGWFTAVVVLDGLIALPQAIKLAMKAWP